MPVRKIPMNYLHVTGSVSSDKNTEMADSESPLEHDFYTLLDYDLNVKGFEPQPVRLEYKDKLGITRTYTPDTLVVFRDDLFPAKTMKPWLCEVKSRDDLFKNWPIYKPKFKAAIKYAKKRGWRFRIMTEKEIRTPHLTNVKFLRRYRHVSLDPDPRGFRQLLLQSIYEMRETDPESLILSIYENKWNQAELLPVLWHLISVGRIGTDMRLPLTMKSRIWATDQIPTQEDLLDEE